MSYEAIRKFSDKSLEVYLFGSAARGEDTDISDIDLLIIRTLDNNTRTMLTDKLNKLFQRDVNPVMFNPMEYAALHEKDKAFYENLERDKILRGKCSKSSRYGR